MDMSDHERFRLSALHALDILDSDPEPGFDTITRLAADIFRAEICAVSLIDTERQWFKSAVGMDVCETPRDEAFCDYTIRRDAILVVLDASRDPVFHDHPAVTGEGHIRFYAGAPVRYDGMLVGTLCVADKVARDSFPLEDRQKLQSLADTVSTLMAMRKDGLIKKEIIRARNETQKKLEMMEKVAGVGYWHVDVASETFTWSRGVYTILGLSPETYTPKIGAGAERYHPDDWEHMQSAVKATFENGAPFSIEARMYRPDGELRWVHAEGSAECDEAGRPVSIFGIYRDITDQKQVEETLRAATRAAEDLAQAQSDFLSNMSHEIRTPLTAIIGYSNLLEEIEDLPPTARMCADRLRKGGKTLLTLVNDVLDFSKLEAGLVTLDPQAVDFEALAQDVCDQMSVQAQAKGLGLRLDYDGACPKGLMLDDVRLTQVLTNLVGNACKFTQSGEVCVHVEARDDAVRVEVRDTGPGLSPEAKARLFQRFSQADRSVHRQHGGSGLGLSICFEIVRLMQGRIGVESSEGHGSTFWFEIPRVEADGHGLAGDEGDGQPLAGLDLLLVDDHAANRHVIRDTLTRMGAEVTEAASGAGAVEACMTRAYDIILMDIHMPGLDGIAASRAIRDGCLINGATPIVAFSASPVLPPEARPLFDGFLAKPIGRDALVRMLAELQPAAVG
ncbi:ATP-binding protein [Asticcacaulis solisilvae]|uniref:ATP-binding protein n=1 Tax=Asticcacaulis solisilvae TaxID=1217274 RepID=UPI003FD86516